VGESYPCQQQFFEPNGNYRITLYSDVEINHIKGTLDYKPPAGTKKQ
jgi:hypothetical protein